MHQLLQLRLDSGSHHRRPNPDRLSSQRKPDGWHVDCLDRDILRIERRVQPTCRALGEAAGMAAALSLDENIPPRKLDGRKIRDVMKKYGAFL